ncbi:phosphate ABC transporter substrate-binding protein [Paucibacter sp. APW11]|uniref:Phosphate ABC transporter substrate-binding protein n=1 Tax=Roseateles aquae TaxID=3077235 RepID=A0ABU3PEY4_9BURK|nr:phosphate ABC transporter substrate-binding protein [Paucibacter sp. APW11]MDT9001170.1 phosphate ABC transporter substrate-binding protein [Paucibacter sp. APW11]
MTRNALITRSLLALLIALFTQAAWAEMVIIVNPKNPIATMSQEQVSALFLGKSNTLPGGAAAAPVDQVEGAPLYEEFYAKVAGKTSSQVKAAWSRLTFSGKGTPPKTMSSSVEVRKFVAGNPDGIGYIEKSAADSSVKIVLTVN